MIRRLTAVALLAAAALAAVPQANAASVQQRGAYTYGAIYPDGKPWAASSYQVITYFDFRTTGMTSERFTGYRVTKTQGPCGITKVVARHSRYPNTTYSFGVPERTAVGDTATNMAHPNPEWYDFWPSFTMSYRIYTICGELTAVTSLA